MSFVVVCQFCVCPFPFGIEGRMWLLIVLIPDHCLPIYFRQKCRSLQPEKGKMHSDKRMT